ncbi:MAG TPA: XRE family transcriptional regulator [Acidobacteriota bacterium]|nr:XRE family transcriptional regulator [Acidobacteriota bacterium]
MDISLVIRHRLEELGLEQRDLASAAQVTESYISQLLTPKKTPPATDRTGIYDKMEQFLRLPTGELAKLADLQRLEELKKKLADPPAPLFREVRELVLRKCSADKQKQMRAIFEKQPFGELERLVTQILLDVVKRVARRELESESWLRLVAGLSNRSHEEMRVAILEFLDTDVFHVSIENCASFLDPLIKSWDIDLAAFVIEISLSEGVGPGYPQRFEFAEREADFDEEPGLREFLEDGFLSGNATEEEIEFLRKLRLKGKKPTALYYYRELQNLRDPLHFRFSPA